MKLIYCFKKLNKSSVIMPVYEILTQDFVSLHDSLCQKKDTLCEVY